MKNTLLRTVVIFVTLCIYPGIHAYDFECEGFYYDITSDSTVSVTHDHGDFYKGDISIPNQATLRIMGRLIKSRLSKLMPSKGKNN